MDISVDLLSYDRRDILSNLMTLFRYDILPHTHSRPGCDLNEWGTFDEDKRTHDESGKLQECWWQKPGVLFPYLITIDGRNAGVATVASRPHCNAFVDFRLNDFFIINRFRRMGIGSYAAMSIFDRHQGNWEVDWSNPSAEVFWHDIVKKYTNNNYRQWQETSPDRPKEGPFLLFESRQV